MVLDDKLINNMLNELGNSWKISQSTRLYKEYIVKDFKQALSIANDIATVAETLNHHPDLTISYGKCIVEVWSHDINGLSNKDFILAHEIESITKNLISKTDSLQLIKSIHN